MEVRPPLEYVRPARLEIAAWRVPVNWAASADWLIAMKTAACRGSGLAEWIDATDADRLWIESSPDTNDAARVDANDPRVVLAMNAFELKSMCQRRPRSRANPAVRS